MNRDDWVQGEDGRMHCPCHLGAEKKLAAVTAEIYSARETRAIVKKLLAENDMLERRIQQLLGSHSDSVGYYRNGLLAAIRALGR